MLVRGNVPCITTDKLDETRAFYTEYMNGRLTFDAGSFITLRLGKAKTSPKLSFMQPEPGETAFPGEGLIYNVEVKGVDELHDRFKADGMEVVVPLEDHEWGDRGFAVRDPNGIAVYCYEPREPTPEFRQFEVS